MHRLALALLLLSPLGRAQDRDAKGDCDDDYSECRETCATAYGSSLATREKYPPCLSRCQEKRSDCRALGDLEPRSNTEPIPDTTAPSVKDDVRPSTPARDTTHEVRRGPGREPPARGEEKPDREGQAARGADAPPPKGSADKRGEKEERPKAEPRETKKPQRPIDEWDPNGP